MAIVGLACFRIYLAPILQQTYSSLDVAPRGGLRAMLLLPGQGIAWLIIGGVVAALFLRRFMGRSRSVRTGVADRGLWRRTPGVGAAISDERWASFASSLSSLLEAGMPLTESLRLTGCASGADDVRRAAQGLADSLDQRTTSASKPEHPAGDAFPPFLRWAILGSEPQVGRVRALNMAAILYHGAAARSVERVRILTPMATCVLLGGGAALIYALALFLPVTELLAGIASAKPGP